MSWVAVAIGGSAVLGAGASVYSAKKAGDAAKSAQRNLPDEISGVLGQVPTAGAAGLLNQQTYAPAYTALGNGNLRSGVLGNSNFDAARALAAKSPEELASIQAEATRTGRTPEQWLTDHTMEQMSSGNAGAIADFNKFGGYGNGLADTLSTLQGSQDRSNASSATFQRDANVSDMETLAPRLAALRRTSNPEFYSQLDMLDAESGKPIAATEGENILGGFSRDLSSADSIESALSKQANDDLALGSNLSDEETRNATAAARAAYSSRGLGDSNSALAGEVLNLAGARQSRLDSRRTFASGVENMRLGRIGQGTSTASTYANLATGRQNQGFANKLAAANMRSGTFFDPASVLGTVDNRLNSTASLGMGQQQFTGAPDYTQALLGYGSDLYSSNANANAAGGINAANAYSALGGGMMSAAGSLGAAYIKKSS